MQTWMSPQHVAVEQAGWLGFGAVGARRAGLETGARFAPVAEPAHILGGDEADADRVVIAAQAEDNGNSPLRDPMHSPSRHAWPTGGHSTGTWDATCCPITSVGGAGTTVITNDVRLDAAAGWIARSPVVQAVPVVAINGWGRCYSTGYARVLRRASVEVVAGLCLHCLA